MLLPSAGQAALDPVQFSATSQMPAALRQLVVLGAKAFAGQALLTPSQVSATSQMPAVPRHCAVLLPSAGQAALDPVQFSATSQTPAALRQLVVLGEKLLPGQVALAPVQNSAGSQMPAEPRHWVAFDANWQLDVQHTPPSHCSATGPRLSITPLPQKLVRVTVTKCPSSVWVRLGVPGYAQAPQPLTLLPSPMRTAASHELLREVPVQVKASVWPTAPPLLLAAMTASAVWLNGVFESPPPLPTPPGSPMFKLPEVCVPPLVLPVDALTSAAPSQPLTSALRCMMPTRSWWTSSR